MIVKNDSFMKCSYRIVFILVIVILLICVVSASAPKPCPPGTTPSTGKFGGCTVIKCGSGQHSHTTAYGAQYCMPGIKCGNLNTCGKNHPLQDWRPATSTGCPPGTKPYIVSGKQNGCIVIK